MPQASIMLAKSRAFTDVACNSGYPLPKPFKTKILRYLSFSEIYDKIKSFEVMEKFLFYPQHIILPHLFTKNKNIFFKLKGVKLKFPIQIVS